MLDEELYNKHHDDERYLVMDDLDEMMMKEHLLDSIDLMMEDWYFHLKIDDQWHLYIVGYF